MCFKGQSEQAERKPDNPQHIIFKQTLGKAN